MIERVVFDQQTIADRVSKLGAEIAGDYEEKVPMLIGTLNSGATFMADLSRAARIPLEIDFIAVSRLGRSESVRFEKDTGATVEQRHVILVEPVIDTGLTVQYVISTLQGRSPASIAVCTLLDRPHRRLAQVDVRYRGFEIADTFLVGYGLDYHGRYRELPALYAYDPAA
ncbi:MAG: hypoxanthine phosphoribosyltransferase [Candidatus Eremiobacteraeota bacterium]|nr:hypoxanthine phosphoribosyltransferase [Candidatus Eremiobacteraeota bacterium]